MVNRVAIEAYHILSPCREQHILGNTVSHKFQTVLQQGGFVLFHLIETRLDEDENRVIATDFHIMEFITAHTVHIEVEMSF